MFDGKKALANLRYRLMDGSVAMLLALAWVVVIACTRS